MRLGDPPASKRNLTLLPLIDVIFLLLIFFMFSSNLSPFSLLQFSRDKNEAGPDVQAETSEIPTVNASQIDVLVLVDANRVSRVNGRRVEADDLLTALRVLFEKGAENMVIVPSRRASVQDLVHILEAAKRSGIPSVAIRQ